MMHRYLTLLVCAIGACSSAVCAQAIDVLLRSDLEAKARLSGQSFESIAAPYQHLLHDAPLADEEAILYQQLKDENGVIPEWLHRRLFPAAGVTQLPSRDGSDGPEDATAFTTVAWGDCYVDNGTTVDKTDVMLNPVTPPAQCDWGLLGPSFGAADAWYTFTLEESTYLEVNTCHVETLYDTCIGIFDPELTPISVDEDIPVCDSGLWRSYMECCLDPGTYYLVIDGYDSFATGDYRVDVCFSECPPDPCITYEEDTTEISIPGTLTGNNTDGPDVIQMDALGDVGYTLNVETAGIYTIDSCDPATLVDADLYLYTDSPCDGGTLMFSSNWGTCPEGAANAAALSNVVLEAGSYHLLVTSSIQEGEFTVNIFSPCDEFEAEETVSVPTTIMDDNSDGIDVYGGAGPDKGYQVSIPAAAFYDFDACMGGTVYDVALYLFDSNPCDGGTLLASSIWSNCTQPWGAGRLLDVWLEPGEVFLVAGDDWTGSGAYEILIQESPERPTSGGPDEMGYTWINSMDEDGPEFEWIDIAESGNMASLGDDSSDGPFDLGFAFPFYENTHTQCYIGSNGYISFGQGYNSLSSMPIPSPTDGWSPDDFIAMLWDDLNPGAGGAVYYEQDAETNRFIVQFDEVHAFGGSVPMTFQVRLYDSGDVELAYLDLDDGDLINAAVGMENMTGTIGIQVNYHGDGSFLGDGLQVFLNALEGDFQPPQIIVTQVPENIETELEVDYTVMADITDATGVASARVVYSLDGGAQQDVEMALVEGDTWSGEIPHQEAGTSLQWWIEATDSAENENTRVSESYFFSVVSYVWPPSNLQASDGLLSQTTISWFAPANPEDLLFLFGDLLPHGENEALRLLQQRHGLSKADALARLMELRQPADREFIEYNLYRDDELVATTTEPFFSDGPATGADADVSYTYSVSAQFDAGESERSNEDDGYWGTPPTYGGPDGFGYTWVNSQHPGGPGFEWVDISGTGAIATLSDDSFDGPLDMGFAFPWFNEFHNSCYIGSNGYVSFGQGYTGYWGNLIPTFNGDGWTPDNMIALFWDDLNPNNGGTVYYQQDSENQRFIIQYDQIMAYSSGGPFSFQARIHSSGIVEVAYLDMDQSDLFNASIGIENVDGSHGLSYRYIGEGGTLDNETAVNYLPPSSCEAVDCTGISEEEPNQGWADGSYNVLRCDDTLCGELISTGETTDEDWFLYTHFGGDIVVDLEVSDFDARLTLREVAQDGAILADADVFPRCFNEGFSLNELESGSYYIVVEHVGDPDLTEAQSYALNMSCSGDPCAGHNPISCDGSPEVEPNEGWNADPPNDSFGMIQLDETICGTAWAVDGARDMDWFQLEIPQTMTITISCEVDAFNPALFLTDFDPAGSILFEIDEAPACHPETLSIESVPAGTYFVVIGHNALFGVPDEQNYSLTVSGNLPTEDMCEGYVDIGTFHDIHTINEDAPASAHHSGTGCPGSIASPGLDKVLRLVLGEPMDLHVSMTGADDADEVILLVGDCANPEVSCGGAVDELGAGPEGEVLEFIGLPAGDYYLVADFAGYGESHAFTMQVVDMNSGLLEGRDLDFQLLQNYPNPFNPVTTIRWVQPSLTEASLTVYNILGGEVMQVELGLRGPGRHALTWDASELGSGVYIYLLETGDYRDTKKAVLLK